MKKLKLIMSILISCLALSAFIGCASSPAAGEASVSDSAVGQLPAVIPATGTYTGNNWGTVTLKQEGNQFTGTYTDTWQSDYGTIELMYKDGQWTGKWAEIQIGRDGTLHDITISEDGKLIKGLADVVNGGGHSAFTNQPFDWVFQ